MPILNVRISQPASAAMTHAVSETLLELTTRILRKKRELTAIAHQGQILSRNRSAAGLP